MLTIFWNFLDVKNKTKENKQDKRSDKSRKSALQFRDYI